jgi:carbonic anhydrase
MARAGFIALFVLALTALVLGQSGYCYNRLGCTIANGPKINDNLFLKAPENWGDINSACKNGRNQSPINFRQSDIVYRPDLEAITLSYATLAEPIDDATAKLVDGGQACLFTYAPRSLNSEKVTNPTVGARFVIRKGSPEGLEIIIPQEQRSKFIMTGGPLPNPAYQLEKIVFKMPSEHQAEGLSYAMEVQFVHRFINNGVSNTAILAVLYYVGEKESAWLSQFTNVERPAQVTYTKQRRLGYAPGNAVDINASGARFTGLANDNAQAINNIVCPEGRLCAIIDDSRVAIAAVVTPIAARNFIFEFAPVSRIEARALLKGSVYEQIREASLTAINIYNNIEDAVLGETWRYSNRNDITFANLLVGSEAPNDPRAVVPFRFYEGSLTNPPCTSGTYWAVTAVPQEMSVYQYGVFRKILGEKPNNRPIQPTGNRQVLSSWYKDDKTYFDVQYDMNFDRLFQVLRKA